MCAPREKYEKHDVTFTIHILGDTKHYTSKHIKCKQNVKNLHQNYHVKKWWDLCLKISKKNGWKALENLQMDTDSEEPKSPTNK